MRTLFTTASLLAMASWPALAQESQPAQDRSQAGEDAIMVLSDWSYDPLYTEGWSVERLFDETEVIGADGEVIGGVENVIIADTGEVLALIAEVGGFWDIGDTHVAVPWEEVEIAAGAESLAIPVDVDNVGDYSIFGEAGISWYNEEVAGEGVTEVDDDLAAGPGVIKATDLIGDYAYLTGGERYGYVNDIVIRDGEVAAIVIDASAYGTPGYYAYPYHGYSAYGVGGWRYDLPYGASDVAVIETFDYDRMQRDAMGEDAAGMAGEGDRSMEEEPAEEQAAN